MGFTATYNMQTVPPRSLPNAYIRASIARADKQGTVVKLEIWKNTQDRIDDPEKPYETDVCIFPAGAEVPNIDTALGLAYALLEASGLFPDATWNVVLPGA